jgi:hypothetical protein
MRSGELLHFLAADGGGSLVYQLGCPHTDIKLHTVTVKRADGRAYATLPGDHGRPIIDDFLRAGLMYEAEPLDEKYRRVYRLMPDGLTRGAASV